MTVPAGAVPSAGRVLRRAQLYWHTLRYLRPIQFAARAWMKVYRPSVHVGSALQRRPVTGNWVRPARRSPSMVGPMQFRLLSHAAHVGGGRWAHDAPSKLWAYQVNFFDDLNAFDAEKRANWHNEAINRWMERHPPSVSDDAWAPYPISVRIVNWIKWVMNGNRPPPAMDAYLATQSRALRRRVEYHLLGNHIFTNAKALVFAGLYFEGREASAWLSKGLRILERELDEQILPDGGQFERSTMYQLLALEDVLDLINIANATIPSLTAHIQHWSAAARKMLGWADAMTHPDGELAFFNDAAIGIAPRLSELRRYSHELLGSKALEIPVRSAGAVQWRDLQPSGYIRIDGEQCALFLDVAPVGPDYLPGHAHADTLSFELSVFGQRVVVNGGTSRYGLGPEREAERGTAAHSTVEIDGQDSSEVWAGFRVARRARPRGLEVRGTGDRLTVSCAHDGYVRLRGRPCHRRHWVVEPRRLWVRDEVQGTFERGIARYHLHPRVTPVVASGGDSGELLLAEEGKVRWKIQGATCSVEPSSYSPEFGRKLPTLCLVARFRPGDAVSTEFSW